MNHSKTPIEYPERKHNMLPILLFLLGIFVGFFIIACNQDMMTITVKHRQELKNIPSASGIVKVEDTLFVVGDNSAWLYQLNGQFETVGKHLLIEGITDGILPKPTKPDFEAMTRMDVNGEKELLIFGSGSVAYYREMLVRINLNDLKSIKTYDLSAFYKSLRSSTKMNVENFNIEAAAVIENELYLFNRENNLVWRISLEEFINYLKGTQSIPSHTAYSVILPQLNGLQVKFSGASDLSGTHQIVFTASVEDAPNTYEDGKVYGSYVGSIELDKLKDGYRPEGVFISNENGLIPIKVESVELLKRSGSNRMEIVMITDSDGSTSELIVAELAW